METFKHAKEVEEFEEFPHTLYPDSTISTVCNHPQLMLMYTKGLINKIMLIETIMLAESGTRDSSG